MKHYQKNNGFTLIELLVVVLIIGILSAVALPQYQKTVLKAKTVQGLVSLKAIEKAQEEYFLANGHYTTDLEELSIQVEQDQATCGEAGYCLYFVSSNIALEWNREWPRAAERFRCVAMAADEKAENFCASYGGYKFATIEGSSYYTLPL